MTLMAKLVAREEGFGRAGKLPTVRHNPGDLRHSPHSEHPGGPAHKNDIGTIDTDEDGWADLERQLRIDAGRGMTMKEAIYSWAPENDGNDSARYLRDVLSGFPAGTVTADTPLAEALRFRA